jgi:hyperosmotically inducible periplasmic protein
MRVLIPLVLAAAMLSSCAQSPEKGDSSPSGSFDQYDKNSDGHLSSAEAAHDKELAKRFRRYDENHDGKLSEKEFENAKADQEKQYLADSTITAKVKTALLTAKGIPSFSISVQTYEGRVKLSGHVENRDQIVQAGKVAAGVSGVRSVSNHLTVK